MKFLVDTHCHLDFDSFDQDREAVLKRAQDAGIVRILIPGVDLASSRRAVALAEGSPFVFAAVGIHPNEALTWDADTFDELKVLASLPKVVAIGEIGLDYYRERSPKVLQQRIFQEQLDLAADLELPVIIHNRDAADDTISTLKSWTKNNKISETALQNRCGVLHSFSGTLELALEAIDYGFYIGFTGPITFKNAEGLRQIAGALPLNKILVETDSPFLAPQPERGKRNEPAFVRYTVAKLAEIHQQPFDKVALETMSNSETLIRW